MTPISGARPQSGLCPIMKRTPYMKGMRKAMLPSSAPLLSILPSTRIHRCSSSKCNSSPCRRLPLGAFPFLQERLLIRLLSEQQDM